VEDREGGGGTHLAYIPIAQGAGWVSELVWTQTIEEKSCASAGDQTPVVQSVVKTLY
jgi:hypothetical protein